MRDKSVLFIVDMNNGFTRKGALASERVVKIIPGIVEVLKKFIDNEDPVIAFTDCHKKDASEFNYFPPHCIEGTEEVELVDEIKEFKHKIDVIEKNSTNGFLEEKTQVLVNRLMEEGYKDWYITGCVTDICVKQFAVTLKTFFNMKNINNEVIVIKNCVETYDGPGHDAKEISHYAFMDMETAGVKLIDNY